MRYKLRHDQPRPDAHCSKTELTAEQLAALRTFATQHGRTWKAVLRDAWFSGNYPHSADENSDALLQQIRNTFGPGWLVSFKLGA